MHFCVKLLERCNFLVIKYKSKQPNFKWIHVKDASYINHFLDNFKLARYNNREIILGEVEMVIDLDLYGVFVSVATNGSFSKAAKELNVTQSAISQAIGKIEKIFEKDLFIRSSHGVILTEFGKVLLKQVEPSIIELNNVFENINNLSKQEKTITIGASSTICTNLILPILSDYKDRHFYIESILNDKDKIRLVESGKLDFAIINDYNLPMDANLYKKKLLSLEYGFYYNPEKLQVDLSNLFSNTLIIKNGGTKGRIEFNKRFYSLAFKFNNTLELSHDDAIIEATKMGLGIGFCPDLYIRSANLKKLDLSQETLKKDIVLIYQQKSDLIDDFINQITAKQP